MENETPTVPGLAHIIQRGPRAVALVGTTILGIGPSASWVAAQCVRRGWPIASIDDGRSPDEAEIVRRFLRSRGRK